MEHRLKNMPFNLSVLGIPIGTINDNIGYYCDLVKRFTETHTHLEMSLTDDQILYEFANCMRKETANY